MTDLLDKIEKNYQKLESNMLKYLDPEINYIIKNDPENKDIIIIENLESREILFSAKFNYIGIYNRKNNIWYWAWSLIKDKNLINKSLKIKEGISNKKELEMLTKNNNFTVKEEDLSNIIKISLYYMEDIWYFVQKVDDDILQFISIEEILENYI